MHILRHQIELARCSCGVGSKKICPPLLLTTISTSGADA
jgi:hypothetical protein